MPGLQPQYQYGLLRRLNSNDFASFQVHLKPLFKLQHPKRSSPYLSRLRLIKYGCLKSSDQVVKVYLPDFCQNYQMQLGNLPKLKHLEQPGPIFIWEKKTYKIPFLRIKYCETEARSLITSLPSRFYLTRPNNHVLVPLKWSARPNQEQIRSSSRQPRSRYQKSHIRENPRWETE